MTTTPDRSLLERLIAVPTGNACDALVEMGHYPQIMNGPKQIGSPDRFAGPAFTLRQEPKPITVPLSTNLTKHGYVLDQVAEPGQVVVIDTAGRGDKACTFGSILVLRSKIRGLAAIVTDGTARDVDEIPEIGLPVYTAGGNPIVSKVYFETVATQEPISCGGVRVSPSDIIFGDPTGILVIPAELLKEVVERSEAIQRNEEKWIAGVKAGKTLAQAQQEAREGK